MPNQKSGWLIDHYKYNIPQIVSSFATKMAPMINRGGVLTKTGLDIVDERTFWPHGEWKQVSETRKMIPQAKTCDFDPVDLW